MMRREADDLVMAGLVAGMTVPKLRRQQGTVA
jgi:hypothetical protein